MDTLRRCFRGRADQTPATADTYRINELERFRILLGGLGAGICISTFYGFNLISNYMITRYNFTSQDMTTITTTGIVIGYVTFPGGMLLDYAGPMYVCIISTVLNALGTLLFGLAFDEKFEGGVVKFAVICAIMNLGCAMFDTGSLMAVMGNFPTSMGSVVAIMKVLTGLGASIFAVINYSFFREKYAAYMYFLTAVVVVAGGMAIYLIRFPPYHLVDCEKRRLPQEKQIRRRLTEKAYLTQKPPMVRFIYGYVVIIALVIYITTQSLCVAYAPGMTDNKRLGICIGCIILVFMVSLVAAPIPWLGGVNQQYSANLPEVPLELQQLEMAASSNQPAEDGGVGVLMEKRIVEGNVAAAEPLQESLSDDLDALSDVAELEEGGDHLNKPRVAPQTGDPPASNALLAAAAGDEEGGTELMLAYSRDPQYQGTFWQNIRGVDLWMCWWNTLATWGCGIVVSFNSAQLYRALNDGEYDIKLNTLYSTFIGIGSALGRMSFGFFESWVSSRPVEGRPVITSAYPVSACCMVFGLIFLLALPLKSRAVIIGFFFDSFGNGFSWASTGVTMRTMFAKDIGKHYNFMYSGAFIAVIALNRFAYGEVYAREAIRQRDAGGTVYPFCAGKKCVTTPFAVLLAVNATAIVGALICHFRYRRFVLRHRAAMKARLYAASEEAAALPDREPETRVGGEAMSSSSA